MLRGFKAEASGRVLRSGQTKVTLDVAGGRVVGVLAEGDMSGVARALAVAWGMDESGVAELRGKLADAQIQRLARRGHQQDADEDGTNLLWLRATGQGAKVRYQAYTAVKVLPESVFPKTSNVTGAANAPYTLHILSDFQCPACRQLWHGPLKNWRKQSASYRVFYHHYPLDYHVNAFPAAQASECAAAQGQFWRYGDLLYTEFAAWSRAKAGQVQGLFGDYARRLKLQAGPFAQCLAAERTRAEVERQLLGGRKTGLRGTPTVYLGGIKLQSYDLAEMHLAEMVTRARPTAAQVVAQRLKTLK